MGRPKLTPGEIIQRELEKLQKLTGQTFSPVKLEDQKEKSRQAEAVGEFIRDPKKFINKQCKNCYRIFLVNYPSVANCSDQCRRESLEAIGIQWDPQKSAEKRWAPADVPLTLPPDVLALLKRVVTQPNIDDDNDDYVTSQIIEQERERKTAESQARYARRLKRDFNLEWEDYLVMREAQGNACAICKQTCDTRQYLCVDHNHETGEIRGLLCLRCNNALGLLRDSPGLLIEAAGYLTEKGHYGPQAIPPDALYVLMKAAGLVPQVLAPHQSSLPKSPPPDAPSHTPSIEVLQDTSHNIFDVSALVSLHDLEKT